MKSWILLLIVLKVSILCVAQVPKISKRVTSRDGRSVNLIFETKNRPSLNGILLFVKKSFQIPEEDEFKIKSTNIDNYGIRHDRYQQFHKGIRVEFSEIIVHSKNNSVLSINGEAFPIPINNVIPRISLIESIDIAKSRIGTTEYGLENKNLKEPLTTEFLMAKSTFPKAELVFWYNKIKKAFVLVYKIPLEIIKPKYDIVRLFIDANSGEILNVQSQLRTTQVQATAVTRYSGTKNIITNIESGETNYTLRDYSRGNGIITRNCKNSNVLENADNFEHPDTYWDNMQTNQDNAALDAHFGAEMAYDYFKTKHYRPSYDSLDGSINVYVHYSFYPYSNNNSAWNSYNKCIVCGDGDGNEFTALTEVDVIGHEFGHALTDAFVSLDYLGETGAIEEGLSDIWGMRVKEFANIPGSHLWIGAENCNLIDNHRRRLAHPDSSHYINPPNNIDTPYPITYYGTGWYTYWNQNPLYCDFEGVHENCTLVPKIFFLLSEGETATNDRGFKYLVTPIGRDLSAQIFFNLYNYLTPEVDYGLLSSYLIELSNSAFGSNSNTNIQVVNALYAVGLSDEAPNLISGNDYICPSSSYNYSLPTEFAGESITWTTSDNIQILSGQGTREVSVSFNENYSQGNGSITATYNHGNGDIVSQKTVWIGQPEIPTIWPECTVSNPFQLNLNEYAWIMIHTSPGADPYSGWWTVEAYATVENYGQYGHFYGDYIGGPTCFTVTTSNDCGSSPEKWGYIEVIEEGQEKTAQNEILWTISPNPSNSYIDINLQDKNISLVNNYKVEIVDHYSRTVKVATVNGFSNRIYLPNLIDGHYIVKLSINGKSYAKPLIIRK